MIRAAGIICKPIPEMVSAVVPGLRRWLQERKIGVFIDEQTQAMVGANGPALPREELVAKVDLLIVLGGDGTLLAAARALAGRNIPILAVNLGGLGFLTSVTLDELYPVLETILAGRHDTSERMMLEAEIIHSNKPAERVTALNDAVANKAALARMLDLDVHVDGHHVGRYRADGLIIATPTGSTAYSLAAGGPIIHPDIDAFVITPICPHMLTNRPLVIPDTARVEVRFPATGEPVFLTIDGQIGFQLQPQDRVVITKAAAKVQVVRPPRKTYYEILRSKLRWGER
ncbi:MAG: NAD(+)/NADH kinase [Candidatus Acidiferrales bacterium]